LLTNGTDLDQKGFSKNLNTGTKNGTISATIKSQKTDTKSGVYAHNVPLFDTNDFSKDADISKANAANDRNKNKHIKRQKKRIKKFYLNYKKRYGKGPSYDIISEATNINKRSVGRFVRELKESGELKRGKV